MGLILTPDQPKFAAVASRLLPQFWRRQLDHSNGQVVWCVRAETGLLEPLSEAEAKDYIHGGEYEQRLAQFEDAQLEDAQLEDESWSGDR